MQIDAGQNSAEMRLPIFDDDFYEDNDKLVLELTGVLPHTVQLDPDHISAVGEITDNDPQPHLFIAGPDPLEEVEGGTRTGPNTVTPGTLTFQVRLRDETNTTDAPSATAVSVDVRLEDITATAGSDYAPWTRRPRWSNGRTTLTFAPLEVTIDVVVQTLDDTVGEETETFELVLVSENAGAPLGSIAVAVGTILDDEARVSVENVRVDEGAASIAGHAAVPGRVGPGTQRGPEPAVRARGPRPGPPPLDTAQRGTPPLCAAADDYLDLATTPGTLLIAWPQ